MRSTLALATAVLIACFTVCVCSWSVAFADEQAPVAVSAPSLSSDVEDGGSFAWSGGSGRLKGMTCEKVQQQGDQVIATIVFESSTYDMVRVGGVEYANVSTDSNLCKFEVPLEAGVPLVLEGRTLAMSQPHWVTYHVCYADAAVGSAKDAAIVLACFDTLMDKEAAIVRLHDEAVQAALNAALSSSVAQAPYEPRAEVSLEGVATKQDTAAPAIDGLTYQTTLALQYATCFSVHYYEGGFKVIDIPESGMYLLVPEGAEAPANLPKDIVVLHQPLDRIYLCATSAMALFDAVDGVGAITLTGTDVNGWEISAPKKALQSGAMRYAGKYSAPDYEMLLAQNCDLALESTMILHNPEVKEMIEKLGVPVMIERSSYESNPLGRAEWVKLYGALLNREQEAEAYFASQVEMVESLDVSAGSGKTVVFFAINSDGSVVIRRPSDYIAQCIELGGGVYAFDSLEAAGSSNTLDVSMEQFYAVAASADYLVYNGTIQNPITSADDLIAMSETFADFKAVKSGEVWACGRDLFQSTNKMAQLITDFNILVTGGDESEMTFLYKVG